MKLFAENIAGGFDLLQSDCNETTPSVSKAPRLWSIFFFSNFHCEPQPDAPGARRAGILLWFDPPPGKLQRGKFSANYLRLASLAMRSWVLFLAAASEAFLARAER